MLKLAIYKWNLLLSWPVILLGAVLLALMAMAGVWQLERAKQKNTMASNYERVSKLEPIDYSALMSAPEEVNYRRAVLSGRYLSRYQFLLDNRVHTFEGYKRVGYQVLTPFLIDGGPILLVDRGWHAADVDRRILPDVIVAEQAREIAGIITMVADGFKMGGMDSNREWPRVIAYIDFKGIAQYLDVEVYPAVLRLGADQQDLYAYNWKAVIKGPWMHYSYAFQWFAMCLMLVVALLVVGFRAGQAKALV